MRQRVLHRAARVRAVDVLVVGVHARRDAELALCQQVVEYAPAGLHGGAGAAVEHRLGARRLVVGHPARPLQRLHQLLQHGVPLAHGPRRGGGGVEPAGKPLLSPLSRTAAMYAVENGLAM